MKRAVNTLIFVGRTAALATGLAVMLAVVLGVATAANAAAGDPLRLGKLNAVNQATRLVGGLDGAMLRIDNSSTGPSSTALELLVEPGKPPLKVDPVAGTATGLSADELDGESAGEIGVNGQQVVSAATVSSSTSPRSVTAQCPAGKIVVGSGYDMLGGKTGGEGEEQTDVVVDALRPDRSSVFVQAYEETPTTADWLLSAIAVCATAP